MRSLFFVASVAMLSSCGGGDSSSNDGKKAPNDGDAFPSTNLAGSIDGRAWQFKTGWADVMTGKEEVQISLSEIDAPRPCDPFSRVNVKNQRRVLFSTVPKVGVDERTMANGKSITFVIQRENNDTQNLVGDGTVKIDEITRTMIRGRLSATFNGGNGANGAFTAKRCLDFNGKAEDNFIADSALDSAVVGHWQGVTNDFLRDTISYDFRADGIVTIQAKNSDGDLIFDMDQTWKSDSGVSPRRMMRFKAVTRKDGSGYGYGRDKEACIYDVTTTANKMTIACGSRQFPDEIPEPKSSNYLELSK